MAQSRLEKIGTIYSKVKGMLKSGAIKEEHAPLWLSVYEKYPPKHEPRWDRKPERDTPIPKILYQEDVIRAQFYRQFGNQSEVINLLDPKFKPRSELFIEKFKQIEATSSDKSDFKRLFVHTVDALELDGIRLRTLAKDAALQRPESLKKNVEETPKSNQIQAPSFRELFGRGNSGPFRE
ncbi:hypothetical protein TCAL_04583 [Tigriopus californicus]|uniref:Small ribosomal subunit protein mS23 n=1 Tax=Tigriopus californicus TaxID=6832 RepID=A0A553PBC0_TIGCA|nr:small ribosomal subunit protein mS23-like [Tigriopus californicus]TRY74977.1 hypothetical protein TCAL_04583 [Tigriopus californicus]|eukprot:TCALIF_04583-PA protein Name:"Similar to MRPS23 28S ribosomal protein S23, mitochondrial (Homo sapiens)" AED:0.08 eAED:0.08 QI:0/-1/0/1/-1/1/1/0/179